MGAIAGAAPVKLFCGLLTGRDDLAGAVRDALAAEWGPIDVEAGPFPFGFTDYYRSEMGGGLVRRFFSFERAIVPEDAAGWKVLTNALEERFRSPGGPPRPVNLDPGYLTLAKVVLLSTKDYAHRIYLGRGIYAETTLLYERGAFSVLPWTYPDYRTDEYHAFFRAVRGRLRTPAPGTGP